MASYTLHLPPDSRPGDAHGLDRALLVRDGFSWPAFAFTVVWFLFHRLWLAALLVLASLAALAAAGFALNLSPAAAAAVTTLASLLVGLEASSLRRWTLARRGWPARDAVHAAGADEAEARAVARWLEPAPAPAARGGFPGAPSRASEPVIGLFPSQDGR